MAESQSFNKECACGSGERYKRCCGRTDYIEHLQRRNRRVGLSLAVAGIVGAFVYFNQEQEGAAFVDEDARTLIWSDDHQHFHEQGKPTQELVPQPDGDPPPGKVWSPEHGHWHDEEPGPG